MIDIGQILNTSISVSSLKHLCRWYRRIEQKATDIYENSKTHRLAERLWDKIKTCFRYSFLGRITEINGIDKTVSVLENSKFFRWLLGLYKKWKYRIINYSEISIIKKSIDELRKGLYFTPLKTAGIIVITAISTNTFFSMLLKKETGLMGWIIRGLFLLIGLGGLSYSATLEDIKKQSYFLRRMNNYYKF